MELIRHDDLRLHIGIKLAVARKYASREELLDAIMSTLAGAVIVKPDMVGLMERRGTLGESEPHPFPELLAEAAEPPQPQLPL